MFRSINALLDGAGANEQLVDFALTELIVRYPGSTFLPLDDGFMFNRIDVGYDPTGDGTVTIEISTKFVEKAEERFVGARFTLSVDCRIKMSAAIESFGSSTTTVNGSIFALTLSELEFNDPPVQLNPPRLVGKFSLILDEAAFSRAGIFYFYSDKDREHEDFQRSEDYKKHMQAWKDAK
jgi:hypothetical protein